ADRPAGRLLGRPALARARKPVDRGGDLRRPDPDPRLPARGAARRADAGGRLMRAARLRLAGGGEPSVSRRIPPAGTWPTVVRERGPSPRTRPPVARSRSGRRPRSE